jgi:hypothetical protein
MKKFLPPILLLLGSVLFLPLDAHAANSGSFYVNNAYFKGNGTYDVVVHDPSRDTLQIYVNGRKSVKAKVNKQGWATFQKVKLSGQSKLSFTKRVKLFKYAPLKYTKYVRVDAAKVTLSNNGPKHSYDDFYTWLTSPFDLQSQMNLGLSGLGHDTSNYQLITDVCEYTDSSFGPQWVACMQKRYSDYLKPDTFVNDSWMGDYSTMAGDINDAITQQSLYGSASKTDKYKTAMQEAQKIYERLAVTN